MCLLQVVSLLMKGEITNNPYHEVEAFVAQCQNDLKEKDKVLEEHEKHLKVQKAEERAKLVEE